MAHNQPLAGTWRSSPGNWRTSDTMHQPSFRNTRSNSRDQSVGISGRVDLAKVSGRRLKYTRSPFSDPMLEAPTTARERRRQRRSR